MCRIAGIIDKNLNQLELEDGVRKMCTAMHKGGPDGEGYQYFNELNFAFGHRRLSLIDLSENGAQPMNYESKLWITFNGEIYNYLELKADLVEKGCTFKNQTDTEVILAGYKIYGTSFFNALSGMFAFALFDSSLGKTYLVRDSAGIKPLYYCKANEGLYFASEVKAFKAINSQWAENEDWKIYFLLFGFVPEPYTTLKNVYSLPKGHYLCLNHYNSTVEIISFLAQKSVNPSDTNKALLIKEKLDKAVERHLISDAPIGIFLSGGIDSSLLSLIAHQKHLNKIKTVSINFQETDFSESVYQDIIVKKIDSEHVSKIVTLADFEKNIDRIFQDMDQPSNDGINSWFVNEIASKSGLKAVLSGIGADEIFGGYPSFKRHGMIKLLKKFPRFLLKSAKYLPGDKLKRISFLALKNPVGEYLFLRGFYTSNIVSKLLGVPEEKINTLLENYKLDPAVDQLNAEDRISWFETNVYMQNQLLKDTDYMSMAHGIEVRVPFLDKELLNAATSLSTEKRFKKQPKGLLIEAYKNILPEAIWNRQKKGFTFPFQKWFFSYEPMLTESNYSANEQALKLVKQFKQGKLHWSKLFAVYQIFHRAKKG